MHFSRARLAARIVIAACALAGAVLVSPRAASAANDVTLRATAGAGGLVKADRWTPVRIVITSTRHLSADLHVSWGDLRARRPVSFASPGTRAFELYVRTSEAQGTIHVQLVSGNEEIQRVDVPVRVLAQDEAVTLCVGSARASAGDALSCSATTSVGALPESARGYEVVDRVVWESPDAAEPSPTQLAAFDEWREVRRLDQAGDLSLTVQAPRPSVRSGLPAATARLIGLGAFAYLTCLLAAGIVLGIRGANVGRSYGALAALTIAGIGAALVTGEAGPARSLHIEHATLLQQIPGTPGSLLTVRGIAEFPAFTTYALELPLADATIEASSPSGRAEQVFSDNGHPVLAGTYGLGARQAFIAEGVANVQPLAVTMTGRQARVSNRSSQPLHDCRFGDGFSIAGAGVLEPGAEVSAEQVADGIGPLFTCSMAELPIAFHEANRSVRTTGVTVVAAYRPSQQPAVAALVGADD